MWMDWLKRTLKTRDHDPGAVRSSPEAIDREAVMPSPDLPARELEPTLDRRDGERWG